MSAPVDPPENAAPALGEMAARVAAHDWSATALGGRAHWSPSLRLMVATILASPFPMGLRWGPDFVLIYNDGYLPILGEKHPDALGRPFREAWPELQEEFEPIHRAILSGERGAFFAEDLRLSITRRHGIAEETFFTFSYSPVPDATAASGIGGVLMTAVETTERKRAELALQRLNETLEQQVAARTRERDRLWRVSDDLIGVANFDGHWVSINRAATAILGWSEAELLAMPIASLWHPDEAGSTLAHRRRLIEGGPTERFQNRYRHKDGSYRWLPGPRPRRTASFTRSGATSRRSAKPRARCSAPRSSCARRRRWKQSASSPAASRMTSTICSPASSARST
jgi:PAS domain S-box-containing protein